MARALNLTDAQKQQIKTIVQAQRPTMSPIRRQLAQNRASMLTAAASGAFNQATVQSLANQRALLIAQLVVPRAYIQSQIYNQVLTPEQKAKADQMRQNQIARITQHLQTMGQSDAQTTRQ
jgi:Spy/CpxP family protein refolding chaperone